MCRRAKTFSRRRGKTRKRPETPGFSTGAGRFCLTEGRNPRYAESAEWAGFPRSCFGRSVPAPVGVYWVLLYGRRRAPPLRGQSGYSAGTGIPRLYPAERSRARRGAFGAPVGAGLCPALFIRGRAACRPARRRSALRRGRRA